MENPVQPSEIVSQLASDDSRSEPMFAAAERTGRTQSKFYLLENVPGFCKNKAKDAYGKLTKRLISSCQYPISVFRLNAMECGGLPQDRDRVHIVGVRVHLAAGPMKLLCKIPERPSTYFFDILSPRGHEPPTTQVQHRNSKFAKKVVQANPGDIFFICVFIASASRTTCSVNKFETIAKTRAEATSYTIICKNRYCSGLIAKELLFVQGWSVGLVAMLTKRFANNEKVSLGPRSCPTIPSMYRTHGFEAIVIRIIVVLGRSSDEIVPSMV